MHITRASVGARVIKCKLFFSFVFGRQKEGGGGGSCSQAFLAKTVETGHENLVDMLDNSAGYSTMSKGKKHVKCVSKWCHLFYA